MVEHKMRNYKVLVNLAKDLTVLISQVMSA